MTRLRQRYVPVQHGVRFRGSIIEPGSQPNTRYENSGGDGIIGGSSGSGWDTRYKSIETMADDSSVTANLRPFKAVSHVKLMAANMDSSCATLHFSPPGLSNVYLGMEGFLTRSLPSWSGTIPWTDLIVDLSKQIEDAVGTDFMGSVFLKEIKQTIQMVRNPFGLFSPRLKRMIPRGITAHAGSQSKQLSSLWLEYRYGWKPLYSDVCEFSKLVAQMIHSPAFNTALQIWSRFSSRLEIPLTCPTLYLPGGYTESSWNTFAASSTIWWRTSIIGATGITRCVTDSYKVSANVSCQRSRSYEQMYNAVQNLSTVLGLGNWMQIRDTLWEVLPFSFVVDWFINFNNIWLPSAQSRLQAMDVRNLGYSIKRTLSWHAEHQLLSFAKAPFIWPLSPPGGDFLVSATRGRVLRAGTGVSSDYQRIQGFPPSSDEVFRMNGLNPLRTADGLSLFLQRWLK